MFAIDRLTTEFRQRGLPGLGRLLLTCLARRREDLLFDIGLTGLPDAADPLPRVVFIDRANVGDASVAAVARQVFVGDNVPYRAGVESSDMLCAVLDSQGALACYGFVLFRTHYKRILGVADDVPLIANCFTVPAARGRGLYVRMLRDLCRELARRGHTRAAISCEPGNVASRRGIARAGFSGLTHIRSTTILWRLIVARRVQRYALWQLANGSAT
ncbi:MAG: hypothetical protein KIT60_30030 [Burkholderiaceae bacterium]|nr:hypothetical protein [Burkholderiaceae bacterium]